MTPTFGKNKELGSGVLKQISDSSESKKGKLSGHSRYTISIEEDTRQPGRAFFYLGQILAEIASSPQPMAASENEPDTHRGGKER